MGGVMEEWDGFFTKDLSLEVPSLGLKLGYEAMATRITLSYKDSAEKVITSSSYTFDIFAALVLALRDYSYKFGQLSAHIVGEITVESVNSLANFYMDLAGEAEGSEVMFDDELDTKDLTHDLAYAEKTCRHLIEALIAVGEYEHQSTLRSDQIGRNFENLRMAHNEAAREMTQVTWQRQDLALTFEDFIARVDRHFTAGGRVIGRHQLHQMLADAIAPKSTDDYMTTGFLEKYFVDRPVAPTV